MSRERRFACFDIDGTISRNALFSQVVDALIDKGYFPKTRRIELDEKLEKYRTRDSKSAFKDYTQMTVDILNTHLREVRVEDFRRTVDEVIPRNAKYTYTYTTNLIKQLKAEGYFLIALSGSEMYSVRKFCETLGFDIAYGEIYEEEHGYFTGVIQQVVHKKDIFLNRFIAEHGLTTNGSIGVGDSSGDIAMLELVERPIAFNPEDSLFATAKEKGWEIVVERKNVIYTLERKNGSYILA